MKRLLQRTALVLMVLAFSLPSMAYTFEAGGIYYNKNVADNTLTVTYKDTNYNSYTEEDIVIPNLVGGMEVVGVSDYAFRRCNKVKTIILPSTIKSVSPTAFYGCTGLRRVECWAATPPTVTNSFDMIPIDVLLCVDYQSYDKYMDATGWKSFGAITDNGADFLVDGYVYKYVDKYDKTVKLTNKRKLPGSSISGQFSGDVVVPPTVTFRGETFTVVALDSQCFRYQTEITSISLPNTLLKIEEEAISYTNLETLDIPNSVTYMGFRACEHNENLRTVTLPSSCSYKNQCFIGCKSLQTATLYNNVSSGMFKDCKSLEAVVLSADVKKIEPDAFAGCTSLRCIVNYATTPQEVSDDSFSGVDKANCLVKIRYSHCYDDYLIANVWKDFGIYDEIGTTYARNPIYCRITDETKKEVAVTYGAYEFGVYSGDLVIPETVNINGEQYTVARIGHHAFRDCRSLTSVKIPNTVTVIEENAFYNCDQLKNLDLPESLVEIGVKAITHCPLLEELKIPDSVTDIWHDAFNDNAGLKRVMFGSGATDVGGYLFADCDALTEIGIMGVRTPPTCYESAFKGLDQSKMTFATSGMWYSGFKKVEPWKNFGTITYFSYTECIDGIYYRKSGDLANVLEVASRLAVGNTYSGDVYVPSKIYREEESTKIWYVTGVGSNAFKESTGLTSVTLGDDLITIGESAFENCTGLTKVKMSSKMRTIDKNAFTNCSALSEIEIPSTVSSIGENAFKNCSGLTTVKVGIPTPLAIDASVFASVDLSKCTLKVPIGSADAYRAADVWKEFGEIVTVATLAPTTKTYNGIRYRIVPIQGVAREQPVAVMSLSDNGVTKYSGDVVIPKGWRSGLSRYVVVAIDAGAFDQCTGLTSVEIPSTVETIGDNAFSGCSGLTTVTNRAEVAQRINPTVFSGVNLASCTLRVDYGNAYNYRNKEVWKDFGVLEEDRTDVFEEDGICYKITSADDKTVEVTYRDVNFKSYSGEVTIPSSVTHDGETYSVTGIGKCAFLYCSDMTSVKLPNALTYIGESAFQWAGIRSIEIPSSVTTIGMGAFAQTCRLTEVEVPGSVSTIANTAFYGCSALTISIAEGVTEIGDLAFGYCPNLREVEIASTVTTIGFMAFAKCESLQSVINYADTPQTIAADVFMATDISAAKLHVGMSSISAYKAADVWKEFTVDVIADTKFMVDEVCYSITSVNDKTVEVSNNTISRSIGYSGDVTVPSTVTYDGVTYKVTGIADFAFFGNEVTSVTVRQGVTRIGERAFAYCSSLADVTLPNTVEEIGNFAFIDCAQLKGITLPTSLASLGQRAFARSGLTSIEIPNTLTVVNHNEFNGCEELTSVVLPNTIVAMGVNAFANCKSLKHFTSKSTTPPELYDGAFEGAEQKNCTLYVPEGSGDAYRAADGWKEFGTILEMTSGVDAVEAEDGDVTVKAVGGEIIIAGADDATPVAIYTVVGVQVYGGTDKAVAVSPGIYIVKVLDKAYKVKVK